MRRSACGVFAALAGPAVLAALTLTGAGAAAGAGAHHAGRAKPPLVYLAHLRIQISTTSTWTTFALSPGFATTWRLSGRHGSGSWQPQTSALVLNGGSPHGHKRVTEDLLYENPDTGSRMHFDLAKAAVGETDVTVSNVARGKATVVRRLHLRGSAMHASMLRSAVMGSSASALPRVDPRKLVLAFYYPWYHGYHQPRLADHPSNPRNPYTKSGEESMTAQAARNGIDGFIETWAGAHRDGKPFRLAQHAAQDHHQLITGYLESAMATQHAHAQHAELHWLVQLLHRAKNPAFLKASDGVPVVFVYRMNVFSPAQWHQILATVHARHLRVHLVGDAMAAPYLRYEWGVHSYAPDGSIQNLLTYWLNTALSVKAGAALHPALHSKLLAASVSPGYDTRRLDGRSGTYIPRRAGHRYAGTWRAALAAQPDWVLVTSWNEWYEGTAIEPSKEYGARALHQTRHQARAWH